MKPVRVVWFDATVQTEWHNEQELEEFINKEPLRIESVGWLIGEREKWITLAMSMSEKTASELFTIPRGIIKEIHYF